MEGISLSDMLYLNGMYNPYGFSGTSCLYGQNSLTSNWNNTTCSNTFAGTKQEYPYDSFVKSMQEKKGLSTEAKVGIGVLSALAIGIGAFLLKGKTQPLKTLANSINFKKASSLEEAMNFGKQNLGIKSYEGFTKGNAKDLDVINFINEGLVNTSNKMNGKLMIPEKILYDNIEHGLAHATSDMELALNKSIFNNLDKEILNGINKLNKETNWIKFGKTKNGIQITKSMFYSPSLKELNAKLTNFTKGNMSFYDKVNLYDELERLNDAAYKFTESPLYYIKKILSDNNFNNILSKNNISNDLAKIKKLSTRDQTKLLFNMKETINKSNGKKLAFAFEPSGEKFNPIYHEMGHLQDFGKLDQTDYIFKRELPTKEICEEFKIDKSMFSNICQNWKSDQKLQQTAAKVSGYAQTSPAEFVAEVFADMVSGKEIPDDVMKLYKELKGTMVG